MAPEPGSTASRFSGAWKRVAGYGAGVVAFGLIVVIALGVASEDRNPPENVDELAVDPPAHVEGDIEYGGHPAGGEHSSIWLNCGVYDIQVPDENAVHSLEHGAIWITYPSDSREAFVDALREYSGRGKVIVSPVEGQVSPVLVTAWARQMEADEPTDPNIGRFITEFQSSGEAPEPGGRCSGGVGDPL